MEALGQPMWIGKYRLTSRIATGGMAEVYLGRHIDEQGNFGPIVAVKKLLPHLVKDTAIVRMFLNEARITAQIHHPNVVGIHELGQVEGEPFIAMELLEGRTWADLRAKAAEEGKRVPLGISLRILAEACRGLDAAHRAVDETGQPLSLVHRDFTPDNIHVGVNGEVKVIDFGIAKTTPWGAGTEPGTLKGKFFYMSPEMILAKPVDHRADLFAAGVMLYEQLCGRRPFTGNSVDEVVIKIAEGKLVPPSRYDPSVPPGLEAVCLTALNKEPNNRFPSLQEFIAAMEAVGGDAQVASGPEVGAYVSSLFPQDKDPRRQTLRRAREADPSQPAARRPQQFPEGSFELPPTTVRPLTVDPRGQPGAYAPTELQPAYVPAGADEPEPPTIAAVPPTASQPGASVATTEEVPAPVPPRRSRRGLVAVAALVVVGGGVAAAVVLGTGTKPAAVLLAEAETAKDPDTRARKLVALSKAEDVTEAQLKRAAALLVAAARWDEALEVSATWTVKSPKSVDAWLLEARAATEDRKGKRAETAIKEAARLAPDDVRPDLELARLRELQGDLSGALEGIGRAAKKRPHDVAILVKQGVYLSQTNRLDEAADALQAVLKKGFNAEAAAELGFVKIRKEQAVEAVPLLKRAVQAQPDLMVAHYYLAAALYAKRDVKGARAEYLEADKLAGADTRPLLGLCEMEKQQEAAAELEGVKKRIKERFPQQAAALVSKCAP